VDTDRRILEAAAVVFDERGFHGASMDELGSRAGLSGPAIYRHFAGKDEILATLFNEAMDELLSATAAVHDEPQRDLVRLVRHHVQFAVMRRHLVSVYQHEERSLVDPWRRQFARRRQQYVARWESVVAACAPGASPTTVAAGTQAYLGMIFSIALWPPAAAATENLADTIVALILDGLAGLNRS
jgi:AcrR family transcriptional regulator